MSGWEDVTRETHNLSSRWCHVTRRIQYNCSYLWSPDFSPPTPHTAVHAKWDAYGNRIRCQISVVMVPITWPSSGIQVHVTRLYQSPPYNPPWTLLTPLSQSYHSPSSNIWDTTGMKSGAVFDVKQTWGESQKPHESNHRGKTHVTDCLVSTLFAHLIWDTCLCETDGH